MNDARRNGQILLLCLFFALLTVGGLRAEPLGELVGDALVSRLEQGRAEQVLRMGERRIVLRNELPRFYRDQDYEPAWIVDRGVQDQAGELVEVLRAASEQGLCPEDYHLVYIEELLQLIADARRFELLPAARHLADLEMLLTDAFLRYTDHMTAGRVSPDAVMAGWHTRPRRVDAVRLLRYGLATDRLSVVLGDMMPPHRGFHALMEHLHRLRRISALGGWPQVPPGPALRRGAAGERVRLLNRRLQLGGDLAGEGGNRFTGATRRAVIRFQGRHGLAADGAAGEQTLAALNVSVEERIRQIELNMERWRWLPKSLGLRHLRVNIAEFRLRAFESGETVLDMPVIVGTSYRHTPVFSDIMRYLEFAPYWNVPPTVLREDLLPRIKADPSFFETSHYEMTDWQGNPLEPEVLDGIDWDEIDIDTFPGLLRQEPGPWNSLGRVKFMFPNRFAVYMHDTPKRGLFSSRVRSYSSGCIRVERPVDLAMWLLQDKPGWDFARIDAAMQLSEPLRVELERTVPVHVLYLTAWVDDEGRLSFRPDYYLRDAGLELALREARRRH